VVTRTQHWYFGYVEIHRREIVKSSWQLQIQGVDILCTDVFNQ